MMLNNKVIIKSINFDLLQLSELDSSANTEQLNYTGVTQLIDIITSSTIYKSWNNNIFDAYAQEAMKLIG
ncbi:unnamed protein product [Paramecium sonneborni]|uniref:Uncharacterized protein n=1 Tax=Paramecium sonneborni TaxID=65129 RepID=A0A8S1NVD2_9CILI|nr:unnamed protein product [Paramecium sonneborni]